MSVSTERRRRLVTSLAEKEERDAFVSEQIGPRLSLQIRALRDARGFTQAKLGELVGTKQERISLYESHDYSGYSLNTLVKLASAFDVALVVGFAPYSELVDWFSELSPEKMAPAPFADDAGLTEPCVSPLAQP